MSTQTVKKTTNGKGYTYEIAPEPTRVDGWFLKETGAILEGILVERATNDLGAYYKVRINRPAKSKGKDGNATPITHKVGSVLAVTEAAKMRDQWGVKMKTGPLAVFLEIGQPRTDGPGYEITVGSAPAF